MASPSREALPPSSACQPIARREAQNLVMSHEDNGRMNALNREDNLLNGRMSWTNRELSGMLDVVGGGGEPQNHSQVLEVNESPN
eukprot:c31561_g1_i1 orf=1-255(+)